MTVSSTTTRSSGDGNGTQHSFPYGFKIFANGDLTVLVRSLIKLFDLSSRSESKNFLSLIVTDGATAVSVLVLIVLKKFFGF